MLVFAVTFSGFGGIDTLFGVPTIFAPTATAAAYTGKTIHTVEYLLGASSDNNTRTSGTTVFSGASWNTVKGTAGFANVIIDGSGIRVRNAFIELLTQNTGSTTISDIALTLDVEGGPAPGTDIRVGEETTTNVWVTSGLTGQTRSVHDVTALFDRQSDSTFNAGLDVVAGSTITGPSTRLRTMKLVLTYENDYTSVAHDEVKTVRFPLDSTNGADTGTRQAQCAAAGTCSFTYKANIPDAVADGDILDVWFELTAEINSGTASTLRPTINGGTVGTAYNWTEVLTDDHNVNIFHRPPVGGSDFLRNTNQQLDILMGTVAANALGGELVVTYRYATDATTQTETVRYYMDQRVTADTNKNTFRRAITISNAGASIKRMWYKVHTAPIGADTFSVFATVGAGGESSNAYTIAATNPRAGDSPTVFYEMGAASTSFNFPTTIVAGATQHTANGDPPGVELYVTFTWSGSSGGTQTKTSLFSAAQPGADATASSWQNRAVYLALPETVGKDYRSAYVETTFHHSNATSITTGTVTAAIYNDSNVFTETADATSEAYMTSMFTLITSASFSEGASISWRTRTIEINQTKSTANTLFFTNVVVVTYDAELEPVYPTFVQNYFRFYADNGALDPTDPWPSGGVNLGENAEITPAYGPPISGDDVRLRMSLQVETIRLFAGTQQFKLQYGTRVTTCGAIAGGSWTDVGASTSASIWRGFNTSVGDGTALSGDPPTGGDLNLSVSDRAGTYEESSPSPVNPFAVELGEDVEFDWTLRHNGADNDTPYCFRMVESDGTEFGSYNFYPVIRTAGYTPRSQNWQWYEDETNETPVSSLASENIAPTDIEDGNIMKLRMTINEINAIAGTDIKFKLQYSATADFSANVQDVIASASCDASSGWCYYDGSADDDDDVISTRVLTDSTSSGRHNEIPTSSSTCDPAASTATEYEFTITQSGAQSNTVYYFRAYDVVHDAAVPVNTGEPYPSLSTGGATLAFEISGLPEGTSTEGIQTDITTSTTSLPFGTLTDGAQIEGGQRLLVTTSAVGGYQVLMYQDQDFIQYGDAFIPGVTGTNASPADWSTGCAPSAKGCYGYHAGDDTLAGSSSRFAPNDTYAQLESVAREVMHDPSPVTSQSVDIVFKVQVTDMQEAGEYTQRIIYVVVPTF